MFFSATIIYLIAIMISGFLFAGGLYKTFCVSGKCTRGSRYLGAAVSVLGAMVFFFTLIPIC